MFAQDQLSPLTAQAEAMIARGDGRQLMLLPDWWRVISVESFSDRIRNTPTTMANAAKVRCPSLYMRGDQMPAAYPAEAFAERAGAPCEVRILPNCDHFYTGRESDVANQVALWLKQTCKLDQS